VDIPVDTGDFRLLSRKAVDALKQLDERNRYMKGLFAWVGLPTTVILYDRAPRAGGKSQWGWGKLVGLALDGISSFSTTPLRLATLAGLLTMAGGVLFAVWIAAKALFGTEPVAGYPSLVCLVTLLGGVQLLCIGVLGEYLGKTYVEVKRRPIYLVDKVVATPKKASVTTEYSPNSCDPAPTRVAMLRHG